MVVTIFTTLQDGRSGSRTPAEALYEYYSILQNFQTYSGAHPTSYAMDAGDPTWVESGRGVKVTTHLHLWRSRSTAARLLRSWVRIPPGAWVSVCCECYVLSGRGLCDELITRPEEFYRLWCVALCDIETSSIRSQRDLLAGGDLITLVSLQVRLPASTLQGC